MSPRILTARIYRGWHLLFTALISSESLWPFRVFIDFLAPDGRSRVAIPKSTLFAVIFGIEKQLWLATRTLAPVPSSTQTPLPSTAITKFSFADTDHIVAPKRFLNYPFASRALLPFARLHQLVKILVFLANAYVLWPIAEPTGEPATFRTNDMI
jgi:hypothetical protein